ncbi:MAG: XrtA-associated tyrosine autokinase [Alkalimonas sp.]|nr:XrtA-associated tyrosine autokinase [Alkalimonas sp.]
MSTIEKAVNKQADLDQQGKQPDVSNETEQHGTEQKAQHMEARAQAALKRSNYLEKATIQLDLKRLESLNFVSLSPERRVINEELRTIKRKLLNNAFGALSSTLNHPNLIMVSSSRPGEGKTFTAVNLALSMALEKDKTVLLIDADVLRPNVSKTLGFAADHGLTDYLSGDELTVEDVLLSTNVDRLKVIAAGAPHHLSTELLASEKMLNLATEFATRYPDRVVIFDAPPLLGVNETAVLAAMCGQALVVVEENQTKLAEIEQAVALLPEELAVGFVINKAHRNQGKGYGYYYSKGA